MKPMIVALAGLALATAAPAQLTVPAASPTARLEQAVGLAGVSLEYSRPGVKGRDIFGGLEPYGVVWRTGANASTKIAFDRDVQFDGQDVPAGTYALYTIPEADAWTIILSKNIELWGAGGYDEADDLLRTTAAVTRLPETCETFTIDFRGFHANGAEMFLRWDDVEVAVPIHTDTDAVVLAQIDEQVKRASGPVDANTYFDAAKYYVEREIDMEQAARWVENAVAMRPEAFWMTYYRAELAHTMGDLEAATTWATRARDTAQAAPNDFGYVDRSQKLLEAVAAEAHGG